MNVISLLMTIALHGAMADTSATLKDFQEASNPKALVFISAYCPCSQAHIEHLKKLNKEYTNLNLFAVATDADLTSEHAKTYYEDLNLKVVREGRSHLIKKYKALKTPHVSLIKEDKTVYQGGVTNKRDPDKATRFYLKEALEDLKEGHLPKTKRGRSLGCYIRQI